MAHDTEVDTLPKTDIAPENRPSPPPENKK